MSINFVITCALISDHVEILLLAIIQYYVSYMVMQAVPRVRIVTQPWYRKSAIHPCFFFFVPMTELLGSFSLWGFCVCNHLATLLVVTFHLQTGLLLQSLDRAKSGQARVFWLFLFSFFVLFSATKKKKHVKDISCYWTSGPLLHSKI